MLKLKNLLLFLIVFKLNSQTIENFKNGMVFKINSTFLTSNTNLDKNKTGYNNLDKLLNSNEVKVSSIGNNIKTRTFLLEFINFNNTTFIENFIEKIKKLKGIEYFEPNYQATGGGQKIEINKKLIPNDIYLNRQWGVLNNGTFNSNSINDADSDIDLAWDIETGDPNLIIAVSDTGLNLSHPDIQSRIWNKQNIEIIDGVDNDNNGLIDDYRGWDWVNNDNNPTDDHGHGTNCTGIVGAIPNNGLGYAGINWNSKIMVLKVLNNSNSGTYASMANSIYYAVDNGAKIISMSIGGSSPSTLLSNALDYANQNDVTFVACMMNFNNNVTYYPAGYASSKGNVIAVGSTDPNDKRSNPFFWSTTSGSNYGNHITVVAPGNFIYSIASNSNTNYDTYWGGTSQATPLVAGVASLLKSKFPSLTPLQIKNLISNSAQDLVGISSEDTVGWDQYMGFGRVNGHTALQNALSIYDYKLNNSNFTIENPVNNYLNIVNNNHGEFFELFLYTIDGKLLEKIESKNTNGLNSFPFNYNTGNYILVVKSNDFQKSYKLIKK
jgi:thermitase